MKTMKRCMAVLLIALTVATNLLTPLTARAAEGKMVIGEITVDEGKLREGPGKTYAVTENLSEGTLVYLVGSTTNKHNNVWFEVSYFGQTKYIVASAVKEHSHSYNIPVYKENSTENCYVCECGSMECSPNGMQSTFTSVTAALAGLTAAEKAVAGLFVGYGFYKAADLGYIIPVTINKAGSMVTRTTEKLLEEIEELKRNNKSDDEDSSAKKVYYPAIIIENDKDSVQLVDYTRPFSINQACDYLDAVLAAKNAFGNFKLYMKDNEFEGACNIYTLHKDDAEKLCKKICSCLKNNINSYGKSNGTFAKCEKNSDKNLNGTYYHYHLLNKFDPNTYDKAVTHVLFGDPLFVNNMPTNPVCN